MGTCFEAQVEVQFDDKWQAVSRWDLQKDYAFARAFYTIAHDLWPKDTDELIGYYDEDDTDARLMHDGKRHADGLLVAVLQPVDDILWFPWANELQSHVERLTVQYKVRVIWWEV